MKNWMETIYHSSPVAVQNLAVSLMGMKLRKERYHKSGEIKLKELQNNRGLSTKEFLSYRDSAFVDMARYAIENTEFYSAWARDNGISLASVQSIDDIYRFPVIQKSLIQANPQLFKAKHRKSGKAISLNTSGTTGTPLTVYTDSVSRSNHYAFFSRLRREHGVVPGSKRATLMGRIVVAPSVTKPPFWRYDFVNKNLLMSSYHLSKGNLVHYYKKLRDFGPDEIFAYPSSLIPLAQYIVSCNMPRINLNLIMVTAETLEDHQVRLIHRAFNAKLVNQYGCTEMAFFASGVSGSPLTLEAEHGVCEVLKGDGTLSWHGQGALVASGFVNRSMPVIRYLVGDEVDLDISDDGRHQVITKVHGRKDDVVYKKNGTPVGRLDSIFKGDYGLVCAQIVQEDNGDLHINIVPSWNVYKESFSDLIARNLRYRMGNDFPVKVNLVDDIPRGNNGKFKSVICKYNPMDQVVKEGGN